MTEEKFQQRVSVLAEQVLLKETKLSQLLQAEDVDEEERGRLINAVRRRIINAFERILKVKVAEKNVTSLPGIRRRMADLFELEEDQFAPTPQKMEQDLVDQGIIYLFDSEDDCLARAKLQIETKFIDLCRNVGQQRRVIQIVQSINREDLTGLGRLAGVFVYQMRPSILRCLTIITVGQSRSVAPKLDGLKLDLDDDWGD